MINIAHNTQQGVSVTHILDQTNTVESKEDLEITSHEKLVGYSWEPNLGHWITSTVY